MTLAVQQNLLDSMLVAERRAEKIGSHSMDFSLFSLPIATQAVYSVLLMIPIGALVILFLRNFVGVKTFGTFMPVLVALAFRETLLVGHRAVRRDRLARPADPLLPGEAAIAAGAAPDRRADGGRAVDGRHQRAQSQARHPARLSIALFPMVIISMTIERMSIVWEERGASEAIQEGTGSLVVAAAAYVVMGIAAVAHLIFVFPELLLLVIAAALLAGRYTGYRLLELRRFKALRAARNASRHPIREHALMFGSYGALLREGVLGLNKRNGDYISRFNPRRLYPLVDDKLKTKRLALEAGIAVPQLYGVIETQHDIRTLPDIVRSHNEFALKPAHGSAGDGIVVIAGRSGNRYRTIGGDILDEEFLSHHLSNAINGQFSLGGVQDVVIVEYMVRFSPLFERISYQGVPDIRVIVFRGVPVMAMVRLPTRASRGKANLHQGAVGAGIDIATGITLDGVIGTEVVTHHPDTTHAIAGLRVPDWDTILGIARVATS